MLLVPYDRAFIFISRELSICHVALGRSMYPQICPFRLFSLIIDARACCFVSAKAGQHKNMNVPSPLPPQITSSARRIFVARGPGL